MKHIICTFSFLAFFCIPNLLDAQKKEIIQIKIVEETTDEHGNIQRTEKVFSGEEAKQYMEKHGQGFEEIDLDKHSESQERIILEKDGQKEIFELNTDDKNIEWDSDESIIVKIIKNKNDKNTINHDEKQIFIIRDSGKDIEKSYRLILQDEDGKTKIIEWEGDGDMPMEIKEKIIIEKIHLGDKDHRNIGKDSHGEILRMPDSEEENHHIQKEYFFTTEVNQNANKAFLGITIENGIKGVRILGFAEHSAAKNAGLQEGDEIFKVRKEKVKTMEELISALKTYKPGDEIKIRYYRNGKKGKVKAILNERPTQRFEFKNFINKELGKNEYDFHPKPNNHKQIIIETDNEMQKELEKTIILEIEGQEQEMESIEEEIKELEMELDAINQNKQLGKLALNNYKAFPNPTVRQLTLSFEAVEMGDLWINMVDGSGNWVLKEVRKKFTGKFEQEFDLSNASKGNVVISITQNGKRYTDTIIIE